MSGYATAVGLPLPHDPTRVASKPDDGHDGHGCDFDRFLAASKFIEALLDGTEADRLAGASTGAQIPEIRVHGESPQQRLQDAPVNARMQRPASDYHVQQQRQQHWQSLLRFIKKTNRLYENVQTFLCRSSCHPLVDWSEECPSPSYLRELGLQGLKAIDGNEHPNCLEAFSAMLTQHAVWEVDCQSNRDNSAVFAWKDTYFRFPGDEIEALYAEVFLANDGRNPCQNPATFTNQSSSVPAADLTGSGGQFENVTPSSLTTRTVNNTSDGVMLYPTNLTSNTNNVTASTEGILTWAPLGRPSMENELDDVLLPSSTYNAHGRPQYGDLRDNMPMYPDYPVAGNGTDVPWSFAPEQPDILAHQPFGAVLNGYDDLRSIAMNRDLKSSNPFAVIRRYILSMSYSESILAIFSTSHLCHLPKGLTTNYTTSISDQRKHLFTIAIQSELFDPLSSGLTTSPERSIVKGIISATGFMFSVGNLRCLRQIEIYLLSLGQHLLSSQETANSFAVSVLNTCLQISQNPHFRHLCYSDAHSKQQHPYSSDYVDARLKELSSAIHGDFTPKGLIEEMCHGQQQHGMQSGQSFSGSFSGHSTSISQGSDLHSNDPDEVRSQDITTNPSDYSERHCPHCPKKYSGRSSTSSLSRHVRTKHTVKTTKCPYCDVTGQRTDNLKEHIRKVHPGFDIPKGKRHWAEASTSATSSASHEANGLAPRLHYL